MKKMVKKYMAFQPLRPSPEEDLSEGPYRILSVEDDPTDFYILKVILEKYFKGLFEIDHQKSLRDLYKKIENFKPHILLLDYYLHGETSFETIDYLKSNYPYMYISILSGQEDIRTV
ncbi:MAG: response regulator, partial [Methanobacteriota archaeon]